MNIRFLLIKSSILLSCAGIVLSLGTMSARGGTADCPPASTRHTAQQAHADRITLLEKDVDHAPSQLVFNPVNAGELLIVEDNGTVHRLEIARTGGIGTEAIPSDIPVSTAAFSPDGQRIALGRADGTIRLIDSRLPANARILRGPQGRVIALAFSPDGRRLAAEGLDGKIHLWSGPNLVQKVAFRGASLADVIRFSRDGSEMAAGTYNGLFVFSSLGEPAQLPPPKRFLRHGTVLDINFTANADGLRSADADGIIHRWAKDMTRLSGCKAGDGRHITAMSFSPDGTHVAAGYLDGTVVDWHVQGGNGKLRVLHAVQSPIRSLAFSPKGDALAVASLNGTVRLWRFAQ